MFIVIIFMYAFIYSCCRLKDSYSVDYKLLLSKFIQMLKSFQIWPWGNLSTWLLFLLMCYYSISSFPYFWGQHDVPDSSPKFYSVSLKSAASPVIPDDFQWAVSLRYCCCVCLLLPGYHNNVQDPSEIKARGKNTHTCKQS